MSFCQPVASVLLIPGCPKTLRDSQSGFSNSQEQASCFAKFLLLIYVYRTINKLNKDLI
jgi:hypothetical protein